jgi:Uma2 family endonuclease
MAREYAVVPDENVPIPPEAYTFEGFLRWVESDSFPETGRIDFLAGDVEVEMSPEDLHTHGVVKTAIALTLGNLIYDTGLGDVYLDSSRLQSRAVGLSAEPDVFVVLRETLEVGRARFMPTRKGRSGSVEGAPDLVVEIVSDGSIQKDTRRLPRLYGLAGVPELWMVDCRGDRVWFEIHTLQAGRYVITEAEADGWVRSPLLGRSFRLVRWTAPPFPWRYRLEHRD